MKARIIKAGVCTALTAAVVMALAGLVPVTALGAPAVPDVATKLAGKTVFLDPGHQGSIPAENQAKQVSDGRGGTKECQTTGMTTVNGVPEHTINWNVAQLVKSSLEALGAKVVLSRPDDTGWGGCIDDRARAANQSGAAVAVSIHADSAPAADRGFHFIVPQLPIPDAKANEVQSGPGRAATIAVRDAYLQAGFQPATYAGTQDGLQTRADIAGPALTTVPDVFIEMGNGANRDDAAQLESQEGQLKHAIAITTGLVGYLLGTTQTAGPAPTGPLTSGSSGEQPAAAPSQGAPQFQIAPQTQPVPVPQSPAAPQSPTVPGLPQSPTVPGLPQTPAVPGMPQAAPGSTVPGSTPGTQSQALPGQSQSTTDMTTLVGTVMTMLLPLAHSLGIDNTMITAQMLNIAYTLAATLLSPTVHG
ncbi:MULTISPECIES: N-acetylmuramoyl-L-alanine amidase [unclassified Nocardia]|uniref:N-acetylmuramoyl-L-alanine amidase n=1 Tax=unclassified Nocardia TaxID=2637762 RepID=UPI001CE41125|nr:MULTISPECIES: N-acetylmuramoyl-L-alanine amidase [unclassified Nocardia]